MLLTLLQGQPFPIESLIPVIIMVAVAVGDILLLKLGLAITKAQKRRQMKWVAGSFLIQFGIVFIVCSPLFLMGIYGFLQGDIFEILPTIIPIMLLSLFIDLNLINILHQIGLKRSLVVLLFTFAPVVFIMFRLGFFLGEVIRL